MKLLKRLFGQKTVQTTTAKPQTAKQTVAPVEPLSDQTLLEHSCTSGAQQKHARKILANKIDSGELTADFVGQGLEKTEQKLAIYALCKNDEPARRCVEKLTEQTCYELCLSNAGAQRTVLIEQVNNYDLLRQLEKHLRNHDKQHFRQVRDKLDAIKSEQKKNTQHQANIQKLIAELESHTKRSFGKDYRAELERLQRRFSQLQALGIAGTSEQHIDELIKQCQNTLSTAEELEAQQQVNETAKLAQQQQQENAETAQQTAHDNTAETSDSEDLQASAAKELEQKQAKQEQKKQLKLKHAAEDELLKTLRKCGSAARNGQLKRANALHHEAERELEKYTKTFGPYSRYLSKQIEKVEQELSKLADWHAYTTRPKLEALCEQIGALAEQPLNAEQQAEKIRQLQNQWKSLSKGSDGQYQELWETFKEKADQAYEVCKKHYGELDAERQQKAKEHQALSEQLQTYYQQYDWQRADWSAVEKLLNNARQSERALRPLPREQHKQLQQVFKLAIEPIQQQLNEWWAQNKAEKERLIKALAPMVEQEDLAGAIDKAQFFQKQWQKLGRCAQRDERQLWAEFRALCDRIFERRNAERDDKKQAEKEARQQAQALIDEIKTWLELDAEALLKKSQELDALQQQFQTIEHADGRSERQLQAAFNTACSNIEQRLNQDKHSKQLHHWQKMFELKQQANQLAEATEDKQKLHDFKETLAANSELPKTARNALITWLNAQPATENNVDDVRLLCIQAEVLAGNESPESDRNLRMQYQMQQLQQGAKAALPDAETLACLWMQTSANDSEQLQARFLDAWMQLPTPN
ncbi:DUF349 domain-containing protein [Agaribacterium haliotis]|uniref:DUF349 domain-containing protein n=1 Tax=Agaribacterium haliotis TaxID=2013869 RepID=UPI000BB57F9C|nr:DUF349 domain-containing protein [Agaribacterium haliotis]